MLSGPGSYFMTIHEFLAETEAHFTKTSEREEFLGTRHQTAWPWRYLYLARPTDNALLPPPPRPRPRPHVCTSPTEQNHTSVPAPLNGTTRLYQLHRTEPHVCTRSTERNHASVPVPQNGTTRLYQLHRTEPHVCTSSTEQNHTSRSVPALQNRTTRLYQLHRTEPPRVGRFSPAWNS